jgi:cation:H+ antiporter
MNTSLLLSFIFLLGGFILLALAADTLISGVASIAKKFGLSPRLIGLTVIALGTSVPEMIIATMAAIHHNANIAVGNAIGSNIANIGLVIGITAILMPLNIKSKTLQRELPLLFIAMLLVTTFMLNGILNRTDGVLLLIGTILVIAWLIKEGGRKPKPISKDTLTQEYKEAIDLTISTPKAITQLILGLVLVPLSSDIIVKNAVSVAHHFGVSELVIGLTILALGTSLPELATSIACARKKEYDIIIGNVIGSNIFNILAVLGIPAIITNIHVDHAVLYRDLPVMFAITIAFYLIAFFGSRKNQKITRANGMLLVAMYVSYLLWIGGIF